MPLVSLTRATLRSAEFGFFGVWVYTRVQTPRFCGQDCRAGLAVLYFGAVRPLRTILLNVGTLCSSFVHLAGHDRHSLRLVAAGRNFAAPCRNLTLLRAANQAGTTQRDFVPAFGSGQHSVGLRRPVCPYFPKTAGEHSVRQIKQTTVAPWPFPIPVIHAGMECRNEGTPFRCFGPHTHRKAPVEAQARFSEESCDTFSQDIRLLHTATHYRQAGYNSRNLFSVATRFPVVNQIRAKKCGDVAFRSRGRKSQLGMRIRVRRIRRLAALLP